MSMDNNRGWIGVDLDGTLAKYEGFKGLNQIGDPIPEMVDRVKKWLEEGREVRIMTARVSQSIYRPTERDVFRTVISIEDWCERHIGQRLKVTCIKDYEMTELWDDRAVQVVPNTGRALADQLPEGMKHCTIEFKECAYGHGRLTATNWIDHGCPHCEIENLRSELIEDGERN